MWEIIGYKLIKSYLCAMSKEDFYKNFITHISKDFPALIGGGKKYLLAFSAGVDSTVLGSLLFRAGVSFATAHCNFHLRGEESDRDALFAFQMSKMWGVKHHSIDFDTLAYSREKGVSIEMAARELRYGWFEQLLLENDYAGILTAHHGDDQVETILLNFTRGTSIEGLLGMHPENGHIIRTLLPFSREQILKYATDNDIQWVEDSTNASSDYTRNAIRHKVIPNLKNINAALVGSVYQNTEYLHQVEHFYRMSMEKVLSSLVDQEGAKHRVNIKKLLLLTRDMHIVMYELLRRYDMEDRTDDVLESLDSHSGKVFFSSTFRLLRDREYLIIEPLKGKESTTQQVDILPDTKEVFLPIHLSFSEEKIENDGAFDIKNDENIAYFDFEKLSFPLKIRKWHSGDSFSPFGMKGEKKVSKYLKDSKIPVFEKENVFLLTDVKDTILWIIGLRTANTAILTPQTRRVLKIKNIR